MTARWHRTAFVFLIAGVLAVRAENQPAGLPPLPQPETVILKSPVDLFRELLAMSAAEREKKLASRPPANRLAILAKLREYEVMDPGEREIRLQATQLRWNLQRMIALSPEERTNLLARFPDREREQLAMRLAEWDKLPAAVQTEVLDYERNVEKARAASSVQATNVPAGTNGPPMPPAVPSETVKAFEHFRRLPAAERQQVSTSCRRFFELTEEEKQKALGALPAQSRIAASNSLKILGGMKPAQREKYIEAFQKFTAMSDGERQEFVKNFVRWKNLSEEERRAWRNVVQKLAPLPPLPPGIRGPMLPPPMPPPMPPMPGTVLDGGVAFTNASQ
jgi:hypothetical protein